MEVKEEMRTSSTRARPQFPNSSNLGHAGNLLAAVALGIVESVFGDASAAGHANQLDALRNFGRVAMLNAGVWRGEMGGLYGASYNPNLPTISQRSSSFSRTMTMSILG